MSKNKNELMSLPGAIFTGIGSAIGVALVAYIGFVIAGAGKASIISILIGLLIGLGAGMPVYFLSRRTVIKGATAGLIELGLGKTSAAFYGYTMLVTIAMLSTYPVSVANYIVSVFPSLGGHVQLISMAILVLSIAVLCFGVKLFENVSKIFTVLLLLGLTVFTLLGLVHIVKNGINPFDFSGDPIFAKNGMNGVLAGVPLFAATCSGFVNIAYMAPMVKEPKKNVPKAVLCACGAMSFFWIFLTIVEANVLPVEEVAGQPLTFVARALMPEWMAVFFALTGPTMAILTTYIPGMPIIAGSIGLNAARGMLPKFLAPQKNSSGLDRNIFLFIGGVTAVILLFNLPVNTVVANIAPCTSFGVLLSAVAHIGISFRRADLFDNPKDLTVYRVSSIIGAVAGLVLFILAVRAITLTSALINIALIAAAYVFCSWKLGKSSPEKAEDTAGQAAE